MCTKSGNVRDRTACTAAQATPHAVNRNTLHPLRSHGVNENFKLLNGRWEQSRLPHRRRSSDRCPCSAPRLHELGQNAAPEAPGAGPLTRETQNCDGKVLGQSAGARWRGEQRRHAFSGSRQFTGTNQGRCSALGSEWRAPAHDPSSNVILTAVLWLRARSGRESCCGRGPEAGRASFDAC